MRSSRVLSFVVSLCIIFGTTCGPIYASGLSNIPTLEDMDIDPWKDLQDIQDMDPEPAPELPFDSIVFEPPTVYSIAGEGNWTLKADSSVLWIPINEYGYYSELTWDETETFSPGVNFVDLDFVSAAYAFEGGVISLNPTVVTLTTYNQTYANGEFNLSGDVFGAFGIRLGGSGQTEAIDYLYADSVELVAVSNQGDVNSLGIWQLDNGAAYIDETVVLPETVLKLCYRYSFGSQLKEFRLGSTHSRVNLSFCFDDGLTFEVYSPEPEETGLLKTIIAWLNSILDAIISLPGRVADAILDGLSALFVPSGEDIVALKDNYDELLQERLGFVYEAFSWVIKSASDVLRMIQDGGEYEFVFPGVSFPMNGETITIIEETPVSLDNELMDVIRPVLGTIVSFVCVLSFMQSSFYMVTAMISGASYFEWLKGQKGGGSS